MPDSQGTVGPPSEKTERNIRRARAYSLWAGPLHVEWKFWTGQFRFVPHWEAMDTEFWNEGPIHWVRAYWLTVGMSMYWALPERRTLEIPYCDINGLEQFERRKYPRGLFGIKGGRINGTGEKYSRRASED